MARIKIAYIGGGSTRAAGTMAGFIAQAAHEGPELSFDRIDALEHAIGRLVGVGADGVRFALGFALYLPRPRLGSVDDRANVLGDDRAGALGRLHRPREVVPLNVLLIGHCCLSFPAAV